MLAKLSSLSPEEKARGVITVSAGNAAQAVAWGCALEGIDCLVVMWQGASEQKVAATRGYGAAVDLGAEDKGVVFAHAEEHGVESVLVTDEEIEAGFCFLYERAKLAAEPGGAAAVAALLAGKVPEVEGQTVVAVVSGGNVSARTASGILKRNPL